MQRQTDMAMEFLSTQMGKQVNKSMKDAVEISLNKAEIKEYVKRFNALDYDKKGYVSTNDIRNSLEVSPLVEQFKYYSDVFYENLSYFIS